MQGREAVVVTEMGGGRYNVLNFKYTKNLTIRVGKPLRQPIISSLHSGAVVIAVHSPAHARHLSEAVLPESASNRNISGSERMLMRATTFSAYFSPSCLS
jgi:hypothetical protein